MDEETTSIIMKIICGLLIIGLNGNGTDDDECIDEPKDDNRIIIIIFV
jgi:hypothetical protein